MFGKWQVSDVLVVKWCELTEIRQLDFCCCELTQVKSQEFSWHLVLSQIVCQIPIDVLLAFGKQLSWISLLDRPKCWSTTEMVHCTNRAEWYCFHKSSAVVICWELVKCFGELFWVSGVVWGVFGMWEFDWVDCAMSIGAISEEVLRCECWMCCVQFGELVNSNMWLVSGRFAGSKMLSVIWSGVCVFVWLVKSMVELNIVPSDLWLIDLMR